MTSTEPFDPATSWADPPGMARALAIGVAVGVVVSFVGVAGALLVGGQGWGTAIGMGAFVAAWGGLGFGGMLGGVVWASRVEDAAPSGSESSDARRPASRFSSANDSVGAQFAGTRTDSDPQDARTGSAGGVESGWRRSLCG